MTLPFEKRIFFVHIFKNNTFGNIFTKIWQKKNYKCIIFKEFSLFMHHKVFIDSTDNILFFGNSVMNTSGSL